MREHRLRGRLLLVAVLASSMASSGALAQRPSDSVRVTPAESMWHSFNRAVPYGAAVYTLDSTEIMSASARALSEVLQARVPGLSVMQPGGAAAQGAQIRSRGTRNFYIASPPIVIVDGVRVDATQDATVIDVNVSTSRLDDIAPEDVARIDVLPGAAAANSYGPGAAGGAIVITTKRGGEQGIHIGGRVQSGLGFVATSFPANYQLNGVSTATGQPMHCVLQLIASGLCTPRELVTWNPLENASPFRVARSAGGAFAIDGAVRQTSARLSLTGDRTLGVTGDDDAGRLGARMNVTQQIGSSLAITANGAILRTSAGLPPRGDAFDSSNVISNGLLGSAIRDSLQGYVGTPFRSSTREQAHHRTGALGATWDAFRWLRITGLYGRDQVSDHDTQQGLRLFNPPTPTLQEAGFDHGLTTVKIAAQSAEWTVLVPSLRTRTFVGYDQLRSKLNAKDSLALVNSSPPIFATSSLGIPWRNAGSSLHQELSWNDRLRVGAGARWERWWSGMHLPSRFFKSADLSWLVGRALRLDSLRVRAAYGEAGNWSPGEPQRVSNPGTLGGLFPEFFSPGERVAETEIGADFAFANLASVSLTAFRAEATHLYLFSILSQSPSPADVGALRNDGIELTSRLLLLGIGSFRWDATVRASTLRERTRSLGPFADFVLISNAMSKVGGPVSGYWTRPYSYADTNSDGIISQSELQFLGSVAEPAGSSLPSREASLLSTMDFGRSLTFSALLDYRGGQKLANLNEARRCINIQNCRAVNDRSAPLADQAQAVLGYSGPIPYVEDASFAKLREVSLRWMMPTAAARYLGAPVTLTLAGRNLATWTHYRGLDPELNEQPLNVLPRVDLAETPIPRQLLLRLDIGGAAQALR